MLAGRGLAVEGLDPAPPEYWCDRLAESVVLTMLNEMSYPPGTGDGWLSESHSQSSYGFCGVYSTHGMMSNTNNLS